MVSDTDRHGCEDEVTTLAIVVAKVRDAKARATSVMAIADRNAVCVDMAPVITDLLTNPIVVRQRVVVTAMAVQDEDEDEDETLVVEVRVQVEVPELPEWDSAAWQCRDFVAVTVVLQVSEVMAADQVEASTAAAKATVRKKGMALRKAAAGRARLAKAASVVARAKMPNAKAAKRSCGTSRLLCLSLVFLWYPLYSRWP